jgi:hypothetical protein
MAIYKSIDAHRQKHRCPSTKASMPSTKASMKKGSTIDETTFIQNRWSAHIKNG